jgi:hypothetical protein
MRHTHFLDATIVALLVPSLVLVALLLAMAYKHGILPWQRPDRATASEPPAGVIVSIFIQLLVWLAGFVLSSWIIHDCSSTFSWSRYYSSFAQFGGVRVNAGPLACFLLWSNLLILPFVLACEIFAYKVARGVPLKSIVFASEPLFLALLISWSYLWFLPAFHDCVMVSPVFIDQWTVIREAYRICASLSTLLSGFAGVFLTLAIWKKSHRVINADTWPVTYR